MISAKRKEKNKRIKEKEKENTYEQRLPRHLSLTLLLSLSPCYQKNSRRKRIKDTLSLHYQKVRRPTIEKY